MTRRIGRIDQADSHRAPYDAMVIEVSRNTPASAEAVWAVLADGFQYAAWVVGAARVRAVDDKWPAPGSRIHHSVGLWPLMLNDITTVLSCLPTRALVMQARGWPAGEARVELELLPPEQTETKGCRIVIREDATHGPATLIPQPLRQLAIAPRNTETLRRLAYLAERPPGRAPPTALNARRGGGWPPSIPRRATRAGGPGRPAPPWSPRWTAWPSVTGVQRRDHLHERVGVDSAPLRSHPGSGGAPQRHRADRPNPSVIADDAGPSWCGPG